MPRPGLPTSPQGHLGPRTLPSARASRLGPGDRPSPAPAPTRPTQAPVQRAPAPSPLALLLLCFLRCHHRCDIRGPPHLPPVLPCSGVAQVRALATEEPGGLCPRTCCCPQVRCRRGGSEPAGHFLSWPSVLRGDGPASVRAVVAGAQGPHLAVGCVMLRRLSRVAFGGCGTSTQSGPRPQERVPLSAGACSAGWASALLGASLVGRGPVLPGPLSLQVSVGEMAVGASALRGLAMSSCPC